jgi:hypothetical protein
LSTHTGTLISIYVAPDAIALAADTAIAGDDGALLPKQVSKIHKVGPYWAATSAGFAGWGIDTDRPVRWVEDAMPAECAILGSKGLSIKDCVDALCSALARLANDSMNSADLSQVRAKNEGLLGQVVVAGYDSGVAQAFEGHVGLKDGIFRPWAEIQENKGLESVGDAEAAKEARRSPENYPQSVDWPSAVSFLEELSSSLPPPSARALPAFGFFLDVTARATTSANWPMDVARLRSSELVTVNHYLRDEMPR